MTAKSKTTNPCVLEQGAFIEIHPGIWRYALSGAESPSPLKSSGALAKTEALAAIPPARFPFEPAAITMETVAGRRHLAFPLEPVEDIHGLGLTFKGLVHNGKQMRLRPDHWHGRDDGHTHAPLPFWVSSLGYGIFLDTSRPVDIWVGRTHPAAKHPPLQDRTEPGWQAVLPGSTIDLLTDETACDLYVLAGPTLLEVVRRYNLLCGGGAMPPKWGLGFWHRMHLKDGEARCREVAQGYREHGLPLSVLGLEPGWHSRCYPTSHEWRPSLFPDPDGFIGRMKSLGLRLNLWQNLFIPPDTKLGEALAPFAASHTGSWGGLVPDLTMEEARKRLAAHLDKELVARGISGFKMDEVEDPSWLFPLFATLPSGHLPEEVHALLGLLVQRLTFEIYRKRNERTWGLVRGSHLGASSFPSVLYNDAYAHEDFITALCSSSFSGLLWTPELRDAKSGEEFLRRMQAVCFSPLAMINAWASTQMPWTFPEVLPEVRAVMRLRERLLPYLYSAFVRYHREGIPPIRAMQLEPGFSAPKAHLGPAETHATDNPYARPKTLEVKDQWMFGADILVAPLFAGQKERPVLLPPGTWYDFHTGAPVGEHRITVANPLGPVPLFVRNGALIPMLPDTEPGTNHDSFQALELRHYGKRPGSCTVYEDDGISFDFEKNGFTEYHFDYHSNSEKTVKSSGKNDRDLKVTWVEVG